MMKKIIAKPYNFSFRPTALIRNRHFQSILASSSLRIRRNNLLLSNFHEEIICCSTGSKLLSFISEVSNPKGLIVIIHGWEGSSSSSYVLDAGNFFLRRKFSICRLNLRDHGDSHHLNEGLFHGALIEETFDAVEQISTRFNHLPVYLIGFSLGANFALRIAHRCSITPINNLEHVFGISPPIDPHKTTIAIDNGYFFYRHYFIKKWRRSLMKKQTCFPDKYDFSRILQAKTCLQMTKDIMPYFPEFPSYLDYFNLYTLRNDFFQNLQIPVTIFISDDDPVITWEDYADLGEHKFFQISRQKFGGHCGFLDLFPFRCWHQEKIASIL